MIRLTTRMKEGVNSSTEKKIEQKNKTISKIRAFS